MFESKPMCSKIAFNFIHFFSLCAEHFLVTQLGLVNSDKDQGAFAFGMPFLRPWKLLIELV